MTRESTVSQNRIALLNTGDELVQGDILNSNSQIISHKLFKSGFKPDIQMVVPDIIDQIEQSIRYLLETHRALIITGGLGPTSDDLTRYALSRAVNETLVLNDDVWEMILARFKQLGYKGSPPEGNHQQALFPKTAKIIPNGQGTAAGCIVEWNNKFIFMLPGPPSECLPMVDTYVLPTLLNNGFKEMLWYESWLLFGIGESLLAEKIEPICKAYDCTTGYRLAFPYIEFKIFSNHQKDFSALVLKIEHAIQPYLLGDGKQTASEKLRESLKHSNKKVSICDRATKGLLEMTLSRPDTHQQLNFRSKNPLIEIEGLCEYWNGEDTADTSLEIIFNKEGKHEVAQKVIPLRGRNKRVLEYAVEFICYEIYNHIKR